MSITIPKASKIFVSGHKGLVGSAIVRCLKSKSYENILVCDRKDVDLINQSQVRKFFADNKIDYVFHAAGKVGGILFNNMYQADFLYENLMIAANLIHAAHEFDVKKLVYLSSACIYPKLCEQPMSEKSLLTGALEETNEGYAIAKIAGVKLCEKFFTQYNKSFVSVVPASLYGPNDNFHPEHSHVVPGMMRRFHEAKIKKEAKVVLWGSGNPRREFLQVDDLADALYLILCEYKSTETINIGAGFDYSIKELADVMQEITQYPGEIEFDSSKPDGMPRKLLNVEKLMALGWKSKINLKDGLKAAYQWALDNRKL